MAVTEALDVVALFRMWGEIQGLDNLLCGIIVRHGIWKVGGVKIVTIVSGVRFTFFCHTPAYYKLPDICARVHGL